MFKSNCMFWRQLPWSPREQGVCHLRYHWLNIFCFVWSFSITNYLYIKPSVFFKYLITSMQTSVANICVPQMKKHTHRCQMPHSKSNLKKKKISFLFFLKIYFLSKCTCLCGCISCIQDTQGGQEKAWDPLEVESQVVVPPPPHRWCGCWEPISSRSLLQDLQLLLTTKPFLHLAFSF